MRGFARDWNTLWRRMAALLLPMLLLGACTVTLVPPYDEQIDTGLTALYGDTSAFVDRMMAAAGTPAGGYAANTGFYDDADGRVAALVVRAEAHRVLKDCPTSKVVNAALDLARIPAEVRGQIGNLPKDDCQVVLMRLIQSGFKRMRTIHQIQAEDGFPKSAHDQFIEGGVGAQLRAAITVEIAKRSAK
ncbi:MAG: hypothetical protein EOP60_13145 [Sphingomonadales bacterium]|nr:MAG: hypothetical protein EOP60_13145 [Sphingomonadales bacterium]